MLKHAESVALFVNDAVAAAKWCAEIFGVEVHFGNPHFAFVRGPGVVVGFYPANRNVPVALVALRPIGKSKTSMRPRRS
jgi:uncharacterized protein